ncbi:photosystem I subunit O-like [Impatiens glandulifera]|uniref:photosystem I subunit O-like n=1 Tax=Impatiens glandulifera TaxID=253017 RepID=UPI001FB14476|nr:photosystem I subunit O-like [Impatiens glandulifera]
MIIFADNLGSYGFRFREVSPRTYCFANFERDWKDLNVIGFGLIGWLAPSSIPAINDNSLTGLFFSSIGTELAHFPTGPALTWHMRLFLALTFGQIGFKSRTEDYFNKIN